MEENKLSLTTKTNKMMLEEYLIHRIEALEASNAEYRANEIELTTYIYTLLEKDTPEEYKAVVRSAVFGSQGYNL